MKSFLLILAGLIVIGAVASAQVEREFDEAELD